MRNLTKIVLCCALFIVCSINQSSAQIFTPVTDNTETTYEMIPNDQINAMSIEDITLALVRYQLKPLEDDNRLVFELINSDPEKLAVAVRKNEYPVNKLKDLFTSNDDAMLDQLDAEIRDQIYN